MRQPNWSPRFLLRSNNLAPNSRPPTARVTGRPRPIRGAGIARGASGASPDVTKRLPPVASCSKEWFGSNADISVGEAFPATQASSSSFEPENISKFGSACPNPLVNVELAPGMPYVYSKPGNVKTDTVAIDAVMSAETTVVPLTVNSPVNVPAVTPKPVVNEFIWTLFSV